MAKVTIFRLDGEAMSGHGTFYPTSRKARAAFDDMIADGIEPEGVVRVEIDVTREGLAAFLNNLVDAIEDNPTLDEDDD